MLYSTTCPSPLGLLTLVSDGTGLSGLWLEGYRLRGHALPEALEDIGDIPVFAAARKWLDSYFAGKRPDALDLPLAPTGSDFRKTVWRLLCQIPYGQIVSYGYIAKQAAQQLGKEVMSAQAVGGAVGHNPIAIIIPCHRVVGANGSLTGYAAGLAAKLALLELEGVDTSRLFMPKRR